MRKIICFLITFFALNLTAQDLKNYQIYNKKERQVDFGTMIKELSKYDVVLFGEHHNNAVNHWLQLQTTKALYQIKKNQLILGAEMFERHQQSNLSAYISGKITEKEFQNNTKLWQNYTTDYKPLVDFAKDFQLKFFAKNVTRKYASYVAKSGLSSLDTISNEEKNLMVKLPLTIDYKAPGYPEMVSMMGEHAGEKAKQFVAAQALKDATMAESILKNFKQGNLFLHYNGDYHSKNYGGIYWFLQRENPKLKIAVIEILESSGEKLSILNSESENYSATEFIIVFPKDFPKSY